MRVTRYAAPAIVVAVATAAACSTLAPEPKLTCESDADCKAGEVCEPAFDICVEANQVAPVAELGFDVCEPQASVAGDPECGFRSELHGCDVEVSRPTLNELVLRRSHLSDTVRLEFQRRVGINPPQPEPAELILRQPSRLQRSSASASVQFTLPDDPEMPVEPVALSWPYYHPADAPPDLVDDLRAAIVEVVPQSDMLAPMFGMVLRRRTQEDTLCELDAECEQQELDCGGAPCVCLDGEAGGECSIGPKAYTFSMTTGDSCHRGIHGQVVRVRDGQLVPTDGVTVSLVYPRDPAERLGIAPLLASGDAETSLACTKDADCLAGQFCDETSAACVLDLAGRRAAVPVAVEEGQGGGFDILAHTYCEGGPTPTRELTLSAKPQASTGLPEVSFTFEQDFPDLIGDFTPMAQLPGRVCLPDWLPAQTVRLEVSGDPITLVGEGEDAWICCSTGCLPSTPEQELAPTVDDVCSGAGGSPGSPIAPTLLFETFLDVDETAGWEDLGCLPVGPLEDGRAGRLARQVRSCIESPCEFEIGSGAEGAPLSYRVRIEPPPSSVLASKVLDITVDDGTTELEPVTLDARPLIRGVVELPADRCTEDDCGAEGAVVTAERLVMPDEDPADVPGPYYFSTTTFYDPAAETRGAYVLPVNPGVYVFTVLPPGVRSGGPAPIRVVDVADGKGETIDVTLEAGVPVIMRMRGFDRDASVLPLDLGSWNDLDHPAGGDRRLDLSAPDECYPIGGPQGCRIRALIPEARLFLDQVDETGFIARKGSAKCG